LCRRFYENPRLFLNNKYLTPNNYLFTLKAVSSPLITIITVNYNQLQFTCALLDSIRRNSYKNVETYVVDNASKENPAAHLAEYYPEVKVIVSKENLGFAGGNNLAVKEAEGDYLFFINNDAELTDGCLEKLIALYDARPKLGMVSPLICYYKDMHPNELDLIQYAGTTPVHPVTARNRTIGEKELDKGQFSAAMQTAYSHGAAMMVKKEVLTTVGLMANDFFLYYEELDWCARIKKAGYEIFIEPNAKIYHKESVSVGPMSTLKTYYLNRNRIYFMRRNMGILPLIGFFFFLILFTIPKNVIVFALKGKISHLKAFLKAVWWNVKDVFKKSSSSHANSGIGELNQLTTNN
jgi:GT2 family glycosyltransferase